MRIFRRFFIQVLQDIDFSFYGRYFMRGFSLSSSGRKCYGRFVFYDQDFVESDKG